jgi:two-component system, NtrC family, sensor kinase
MIKTIFLGFIFLFCFLFIVYPQAAFPPVYEIKSDTASVIVVDSIYWQKLEDNNGKWTFEEVSKEPLSGRFHIQGARADGIDTGNAHAHWQRYRLKNTMPYTVSVSLISPVDLFDVYIIKTGKPVQHLRSGRLRKWEEKDGLKSADWAGAIPLVIAPGEEISIYDRRYRKYETLHRITVRLFNSEKLIQKEYVDYVDSRENYFEVFHLQEAFIIGMIFISIFISIFFYRVVKEKVYLYFALFAFLLAINRHYNIAGSYTQWFRPDLSRYVTYIGFAWILIPFFLVQFFRYFFLVKTKYPKWDKLLFIAGLLNLVTGIIGAIIYIINDGEIGWVYQASTVVSFLLIPVAVIITSLLYIRNSNRSFRNIAYGTIPLMLLYMISIFPFEWNFLRDNFRLIEMIFLCWLLLCFVRVLIMRFDNLRKENAQQALDKERLAKEKEIERNELIAAQKIQLEKDVAERTAALKQSLEDLKATQSQLVQSEKMASLGELTAGIAHEIQNPLNFVNNFSEVSNELIDEMNEELNKGDINEAKAIGNDIKQNLEKITHHGKRADAIVKGMLQHSRSSSGQKEPTDINKLADEYLRLAYHGLRAKDPRDAAHKSFNATLKTDYDASIGNINIIPQDMGRVLLNLITNAFYAVQEKSGLKGLTSQYEPTVSLSTKKAGDKVLISVTDNGNGIPKNIIDKIFQPFFTTKPTGQGTGLGLSLSYDIVKAHGGELLVESGGKMEAKEREGVNVEQQGTTFIISLPV